MESNSILKEIFNGDYSPFSDVIPKDIEYYKAKEKLNSEWDFFVNLIPEEHVKRFDELMTLFHTVSGYEAYEFYKEGFKTGYKLVNELSK